MRKSSFVKAAALVLLSTAACLFISPVKASEAEAAPQTVASDALNIREGTIPSNVFFYGESLSGKTLTQAKERVRIPADNIDYTDFTARSEYRSGYVYGRTAADLGVTYDLESVNAQLEADVLTGTVLERYKKAKDLQASPQNLSLNIQCDESVAFEAFNSVAVQWVSQPVSASVSSMSGSLVVTPGSNGYNLDLTEGIHQMVDDIRNARIDDSGWYYITLNEYEIEPALTTERASNFTIIGSYTTTFFAPTTETLANRMQNLQTSTAHIAGHCFAPGETVSALGMYGDVTAENGYALAGTFNESSHTLEMGGGICQTTTTLYNAVLLAELQVTYRRNHSMMVIYVDPSFDAMVYAQGGSDFQFVNSSSDYIFLDAYVNTSNYTLTVNIIGHEDHAPDHMVRYESEITERNLPPVNFVDDPSKGIGWHYVEGKVSLAGSDGPTCEVRSRLWKITTDNGVETRTLDHDGDYYKPGSATYYVAPDTTVTLSIIEDRNAGYVKLNPTFLNGYLLSSNPAVMSDDELISFNNSMKALLAGKGYAWPYSNNGYTDEDPDGDLPEPEEPTEEETEEETKKHKD